MDNITERLNGIEEAIKNIKVGSSNIHVAQNTNKENLMITEEETIGDSANMAVITNSFDTLFPDIEIDKVVGLFALMPEEESTTIRATGLSMSKEGMISFIYTGETLERVELDSIYAIYID